MSTNLNEVVAVSGAGAGDLCGDALSVGDTVAVTIYESSAVFVLAFKLGQAYPVPSGFTPVWTPNSGIRSTGTSLLTGADITDAAMKAAASETQVANFMVCCE